MRKTGVPSIRVAVLMATFNGAAFIEEQVASILGQHGVDVTLFVADDGSEDETRERLEQWPVAQVVWLPERRSGGAGANFIRLLREAPWHDHDFVAFADQDDVWYPQKLKRAISAIQDRGLDAYSSNVTAFWPDGRRKLVEKAQPLRRLDYLFEAAGPGNTYVLSRGTARVVLERLNAAPAGTLAHVALHDWLIYAIVRAAGLIWWIDPQPSLDYRQHTGNVVGTGNSSERIRRRLKSLIGDWYREQVIAIATVARITGPEVAFLNAPKLRGLLWMMVNLRDFRRRPVEAMVLGAAFFLYALRARGA